MYQALYRKYRPRSFCDVYGQEHVVSTLKNEIRENRISHAYLFTGSRGTGKTSCAKILAKAVNCENCVDGEPCNSCEVCRGLDAGTIYDVIEIDAASNRGVDNIRELREDVNYSPSRGRYRVYIIDEVHMLTIEAFNALLKTLEEPPEHVIFILATTEVHKIPVTILSRCQRFDFKRIKPETMAKRLNQVADKEGLTLSADAGLLIARIADGALRDGLSLLDQCAARSSDIDERLVSEVAGIAGRDSIHNLCDCISNKDSADAVNIISDLYQNSYDMERLCVEMINQFRNYMVVKTVKNSRELIICTDEEYNRTVDGAKGFTIETVIYSLDLFQQTLAKIKSGVNARIETEMAFIKLCEPSLERSDNALNDRISRLESAVSGFSTSKPHETLSEPPKQNEPPTEKKTVPSSPVRESEEAPQAQAVQKTDAQAQIEKEQSVESGERNENEQYEFQNWAEFIDIIHKTDLPLFAVLSNSYALIKGEYFIINSPNPTIKEFIAIPTHANAIRHAVYQITGKKMKLAVAKKKSDDTEKKDMLEDLINQAKDNITINFE